jgi:two-component system OmpR family response regulator
MHGFDVLRKLRGRGSSLPVLILTAADSVEQRVKGLDLGADDYMAKPFSLAELEARVRALTRRGLGTASSLLKHGPLTFDATGRVAYLNDQMVELVGARTQPAGSAAAARRPPGEQGPARGAPVRVG